MSTENQTRTVQAHARRLTPEELARKIPGMLKKQARKESFREERKNARQYSEKVSRQAKVASNIGEALREAKEKGAVFRGPKGRFLSIPKASPKEGNK